MKGKWADEGKGEKLWSAHYISVKFIKKKNRLPKAIIDA